MSGKRPRAGGVALGVQVLVAGQVAAHDNEVQVLLVARVVAVSGCAVGAGDGERRVGAVPAACVVAASVEGVAVGCATARPPGVGAAGGVRAVVAGVLLAGVREPRRWRGGTDGPTRAAEAGGGGEDDGEPAGVQRPGWWRVSRRPLMRSRLADERVAGLLDGGADAVSPTRLRRR